MNIFVSKRSKRSAGARISRGPEILVQVFCVSILWRVGVLLCEDSTDTGGKKIVKHDDIIL